jgi:hypothetical protein
VHFRGFNLQGDLRDGQNADAPMFWNKMNRMIMIQRIEFSKKKVSQLVLDRLAEVVEELNRLTGNRFHVIKRGFGRKILGFESSDLLVAVVANDSRPTLFAVVAVRADDRPLFPSYVEADLAEVCSLLGATTEEEVREIKKLVKPWRLYRR